MSTQTWRDANREHLRKYKRNWYSTNKEKVKDEVLNRRETAKKWYAEFKSGLSCSRCGENHPACLDFHHKDPTQKDVALAQAVANGWSIDSILKEVEKCDILCSNCHRKLHYEERNASVV